MDFLLPAATGLLVFLGLSTGLAFWVGAALGRANDTHERAVADAEFRRITAGL